MTNFVNAPKWSPGNKEISLGCASRLCARRGGSSSLWLLSIVFCGNMLDTLVRLYWVLCLCVAGRHTVAWLPVCPDNQAVFLQTSSKKASQISLVSALSCWLRTQPKRLLVLKHAFSFYLLIHRSFIFRIYYGWLSSVGVLSIWYHKY